MTTPSRALRWETAFLAVVATVSIVAGAPASAAVRSVKAKTACDLLTNAEITSVLKAAPLNPGPKAVKIPRVKGNFSRCEWDDHEKLGVAPELAVYTGLGRKLSKSQLKGLANVAPNTTARALAPAELEGLGERGAVELVQDGSYGSLAVVKGKDTYFVSASYQGTGDRPDVTEADMLALARAAAARI